MSKATRRLLLDYQPLWIAIAVIVMGTVITVDWGWLFRVRGRSAVQWIAPLFCVFAGISFMPKMPVWGVLPVPAADRRRAQWWVWIGLPLVRAVVCMAVALVGLTLFHGVHAAPLQIASLMEGQLLAVTILGVIFSGGGALRRRFGFSAGFGGVLPMFLVGIPLSTLDLADPALLAGGGIVILILAAATYAASDRMGAAAARFGEGREPGAAPDEAAGTARGWAALLPYAFSVAVLSAAAAVAINYSMLSIIGPDAAENARRLLPSQMIITIIVLSGVSGQAAPYAVRALRALPVGPAALTAVMQGFILAVLLISLGAVWIVLRTAGLDDSRVPFLVAAAIPIVALRLPVHFRLGLQLGALVSVLPIIPLLFLRFLPWSNGPWFMPTALLMAGGVWAWTWWELAHGRAAYRPQAAGVTRWRGGLN